jgi:hypothetical protein
MKTITHSIIWIVLCLILLQGVFLEAQEADPKPDLTLIAEHDIGFVCPVASALQPNTESLWVLTDNCFGHHFALQAYDTSSGEPVDGSVILLEDIDGDLYMATPATTPLAFTSEDEGTLEFFVYDYENYDLKTFYIDIASGTVSEDADTDERLNTLLG